METCWPCPSPRHSFFRSGVSLVECLGRARRKYAAERFRLDAYRRFRRVHQNFHHRRRCRSLKSTWKPSKTHPASSAAIIITSTSSRNAFLLRWTREVVILTEKTPSRGETSRSHSAGKAFTSAAATVSEL